LLQEGLSGRKEKKHEQIQQNHLRAFVFGADLFLRGLFPLGA